MFCSRNANNMINRIHERALRVIYQNEILNFESKHPHHLKYPHFAIKIYIKFTMVCLRIVFMIFFENWRSSYDLRSQCDLDISSVSTESCSNNSLKYFGPIIWNSILARLRNIETLTEFKKEICKWEIDKCPCRLCKDYIGNVGFF